MAKLFFQPKADVLVDEIKDALDRLSEIRSVKRRQAAARELVEYIQLHQRIS